MASESELKDLQARARGLDPDEGQWGLKYRDTVWGYETEKEARFNVRMAEYDIPAWLVQFTNGKWEYRT